MSWFDRNENTACCDGPGPVENDELVCRILVKRTIEPLFYEWISRRELFPSPNFSNLCGDQDGLSVDRSYGLDDCTIDRRSTERAEKGNNRIANGGLEAPVNRIRQLRWLDPSTQICKIYDDPMNANPEHAVIRLTEEIPDEERSLVVAKVKELFDNPRGAFAGM